MKYEELTVYRMDCNDTEVVIEPFGETWDVYYRKHGFPLMYVFGLPVNRTTLPEAFDIACKNIPDYSDMFD